MVTQNNQFSVCFSEFETWYKKTFQLPEEGEEEVEITLDNKLTQVSLFYTYKGLKECQMTLKHTRWGPVEHI